MKRRSGSEKIALSLKAVLFMHIIYPPCHKTRHSGRGYKERIAAILCTKNTFLFHVKFSTGNRACRISLWRDRETWGICGWFDTVKFSTVGIFAAKTRSFPPGNLVEAGTRLQTREDVKHKAFTYRDNSGLRPPPGLSRQYCRSDP